MKIKDAFFSLSVLLLLANTAAYSVVNAAQSALPQEIEQQVACSALVASLCSAYGDNVCSGIVPQDCGAMQSTQTATGHTYEHGIFYILTGLLLGVAFMEIFRRRQRLAAWAGILAYANPSPNATSPPLLVGGLSSLRF